MKSIIGIFAHPDDESFGPGGTLAKLAQTNDIFIICITSGDAGGDGETRKNELLSSAKILGIKKVYFFKYLDGSLCNRIYHELATDIQKVTDIIRPDKVITFEMRGVTGHIDHIAVSMVTTYVFEKLSYIKEIWYYCMDEKHRHSFDDYFIYVPPGYHSDEIHMKVDVADFWNVKMSAIQCHQSQKQDIDKLTSALEKLPKEECFMVRKK